MPDPVLEGLWKKVVDDWSDDQAHGLFLEHCHRTEQLAEAAARYAGMRGDRERGEVARRRLDAVTVLATSTLLASRTPPQPALPRWATAAILAIFGVLTGYVMLRALR